MKHIAPALTAFALLAAAPSAVAKDTSKKRSADAVFNQVTGGAALPPGRTVRPIKKKEIAEFRAMMVDAYGDPTSERSGVQSWNLAASETDLSSPTTVMIGTDHKGRPVVIVHNNAKAAGIARPDRVNGQWAAKSKRKARVQAAPALSLQTAEPDE